MDIRQFVPTENGVAVLRDAGDRPVALNGDVRMARQCRDLLGLAGKTGSPPAQINLLQADKVISAIFSSVERLALVLKT